MYSSLPLSVGYVFRGPQWLPDPVAFCLLTLYTMLFFLCIPMEKKTLYIRPNKLAVIAHTCDSSHMGG